MEKIYSLIKKLYPIARSITGNGNRITLKAVQKIIPLEIKEVKSGTKVFDWRVPLEWNIKDAYIKDKNGKKIADFKKSNLSIVNYSVPVNKKVDLGQLKKHLYTIPNHPDWIPYKTAYYDKTWGFCLTYKDYQKLTDDCYRVFIDSSLKNGSLTYGELYLAGKLKDEILISAHICHPSLCNDNLSGVSVAVYLAKYIQSFKNRKFSYRFLFVPGTIGSITWLSLNKNKLKNIAFGFVLTGVGDSGAITYKKSKSGNSEIDFVFEHILSLSKAPHEITEFYPYGYDERQYSSPGFNLAIGTLMRSKHGTYPQYHTSADDLNFVTREALADSYKICIEAIKLLETTPFYVNRFPYGEPQLGKRGIYKAMNDVGVKTKELQIALLWVLNFSDGFNSLLSIAKKSKLSYGIITKAALLLQKKGVIALKN